MLLLTGCFITFRYFIISNEKIKLKTIFYSKEVKWEDVKQIHFCPSVRGAMRLVLITKLDKSLLAYWDYSFKEDYMKFFNDKEVVIL